MSYLISAATSDDFSWLVKRSHCGITSDFVAIKAVDSKGEIVGMVGYCHFTPNAVEVHVAAEHPAAWKLLLPWGFRYPFNQLGKGVMLAPIAGHNPRAIRFARKLGFTEVHRIKDGWDKGADIVLFELRRENCVWVNEKRAA